MVVPQALRVLRLKPGRKYCTVGRLGHEFGWKYRDVVAKYVTNDYLLVTTRVANAFDRLEERRKVKGAAYHERKLALQRRIADSKKDAAVSDEVKQHLESYGY